MRSAGSSEAVSRPLMIICQTPYRASFAGGGTDLPAFYRYEHGAVLSVALRHHMYVTVHKRFENDIRVSYTRTEIAPTVDAVHHELVREAMRATGTAGPIEITTVGDVPAGTGLGSSSTLTVGLLNALAAYHGRTTSAEQLAQEASRIEIELLGHPIGKQDQYAAAFGGMNYIRFNPNGTVDIELVSLRADDLRNFESHFLMLFSETRRSANRILREQSAGTAEKRGTLTEMRDLAQAMRNVLEGEPDLAGFGRLLHEGWELKRSLGFGITNDDIDELYRAARDAGAMGGKLLGAGGGGFILLFAPPERHAAILDKLGNPKQLSFETDPHGSRIVFVSS